MISYSGNQVPAPAPVTAISEPQHTEIGAIVVTFHPDRALAGRLEQLRSQVSTVVIIDNGSGDEVVAELQRLAGTLDLILITNFENLGIAKALNQGVEILRQRGVTWALTQDQDSIPAADMVRRLGVTAAQSPNDPVALVAPNVIDIDLPEGTRRWLSLTPIAIIGFRRIPCARDRLENVVVITSGCLVHIPTWRLLNGFDEALFIDFVDTDYCLRAARAGHNILVNCAARLLHRVGVKQQKKLFGLAFRPTFHSPLRRYYLFRNRVRMIRKHARQWPHWLVYEIVATIHTLMSIIFFEPGKLRLLKSCILGTWDGIRGRTGRATRRL